MFTGYFQRDGNHLVVIKMSFPYQDENDFLTHLSHYLYDKQIIQVLSTATFTNH